MVRDVSREPIHLFEEVALEVQQDYPHLAVGEIVETVVTPQFVNH
jgi:hypothetical protein